MNPYQVHASDLADIAAEQGDDCPAMWYDGRAIPILPGGATYKTQNSVGGLSVSSDLSLTILASNFAPDFDFNYMNSQQFNYPGADGDLYSVDSVIKSPNGFQVRILADAAAEGI